MLQMPQEGDESTKKSQREKAEDNESKNKH